MNRGHDPTTEKRVLMVSGGNEGAVAIGCRVVSRVVGRNATGVLAGCVLAASFVGASEVSGV